MTPERLSYIEHTSYCGSREQELAREIRRCWKLLDEVRQAAQEGDSDAGIAARIRARLPMLLASPGSSQEKKNAEGQRS